MNLDLETKRFLEGVAKDVLNEQMKPPIRFYLDKQSIPNGPTLYHFRWDGSTVMGESKVDGPAGKQRIDALVAGKFVKPRGKLRYEINHQKVLDWFEAENKRRVEAGE